MTKFCYINIFFFILIDLKIMNPIISHTKLQPNIPSGSVEKNDFVGFAIFSVGANLDSRPG